MTKVLEMSFSTTASAVASGITLGGSAARVEHWPLNPEGEPLILVATIDCRQTFERTHATSLPAEGVLYVFSTYSATDYFLDSITADATVMHSPTRPSGYTAVLSGGDHTLKHSPVPGIEQRVATLGERSLGPSDIPACSLVCTASPHWVRVDPQITADYEFFCQFYSSDFPEPFKDLFYLTDAVAHLYLRKAHSEAQAAGLFFVHTA